MITKETAIRIWTCYHEIEIGTKLMTDLEENLKKHPEDNPNPRDEFGRQRALTLGVPSGSNSHRMLDVAPRLAVSVIRAHIADKERDLAEANEQARIELGELVDA
jgi:hypothetical protein